MKVLTGLLAFCVLFVSSSALSPKFHSSVGGKLNPFSVVLVDEQPNTLSGHCRQLGGRLCGKECLRVFTETAICSEAKYFCERSGGYLWSPMEEDLNDPFWNSRLLNECPDLSFFLYGDSFYVGPYKDEDGQLLDVAGNPLDTVFFETFEGNGCMRIKLDNFVLFGDEISPYDRNKFICEYPIADEKNSFFNKFG